MFRKIGIAVAGFSLVSLLTLGIHGRLGCATARADELAADDGSSDVAAAQNSPADKPTVIKFDGSGAFDATPTTPCSADKCFSITGTVTPTSFPGLGTGDVTGESELNKCKTNKAARKECCTFTATETYTFSTPSAATLDITFGGTACGKTPTNVNGKVRFEITNGSGLFAGASGSGKATFNLNEDTGAGTDSFKGRLTE